MRKTSDFGYGQKGTSVTWTLTWSNSGRTPSTGTWIIDRIPPGLTVSRVEVPPGGEVWLSTRPPGDGVPAGLLPADPFEQATVLSAFTRVDDAADGEADGWVSAKLDQPVQWVALRVDEQALTPPQVTTGALHAVRIVGKVSASNAGDVVANEAAIFSRELLMAIAPKAVFTVTAKPGLRLALACDDIAAAGETVECTLRYDNDAANPDSDVALRLELPAGLSFVSATHTWNEVYLAGHPNPTNPPIDAAGGEIEVAIGALGPLEGGTLSVRLAVAAWLGSGTLATVGARGEAVGPEGDTRQAYTSEVVLVENADLFLRALVDNPAPRSGERFYVTMAVSNEGAHDARDSSLVVTLPPQLDYVPGTTLILAAPWGASPGREPKVVGRTLTWATPGAALTWDGGEPGTIPGLGPEARVVFEVVVAGATPPGTELTTCGLAETSTGEDEDFDNAACVSVTTPLPDPWVVMSGPDVSNIDSRVTWTLTYGNRNNETAGGVVVIDSLPDLAPADGVPDVTYLSSGVGDGEVVWLHQGPAGPAPAFDRANPASGGWVKTAVAGKPVSHLAFAAGDLAPYTPGRSVQVAAQLTRPDGDAVVPGSAFENRASVSMRPGFVDARDDNNDALTVVRTPGIDLAGSATCDPVGRVVGARPGDLVHLRIGFAARGSERVHGLRVVDVLPAELELVGEPAPLRLLDANDVEVAPIGLAGERLTRPVAWTRDGDTYRLGDASAASVNWYRRVGLRPGDHGVLELSARVRDDVATRTTITRRAEVWSDYVEGWQAGVDAPERYLDNNVAACDFAVYRADLMAEKTVDNLDGASDAVADAGDRLRYRLAYDNIGDATAEGAFMEDAIPDGVDFIVGSVSGVTSGAVVRYSDDGGASWDYTSSVAAGEPDPAITHVRIEWAAGLPTPLGGIFVQTTAGDFARGTHVNTHADPSGAVVSDGGSVCATATCQPVTCDYGSYIPDGGCCAVCRPSAETCPAGAPVEDFNCAGFYENAPAWTGCVAADGCTLTCDYQARLGVSAQEAAPPAACGDEYGRPTRGVVAAAPVQTTAAQWMQCVAELGVQACTSYQCPDAPPGGPCVVVPLWEQCWDVPCATGSAYSCAAVDAVDTCYAQYGVAMGVYATCLEQTAVFFSPLAQAEAAIADADAALQASGAAPIVPRPWQDPTLTAAARLAAYDTIRSAMEAQATTYDQVVADKLSELSTTYIVAPLPAPSIAPALRPEAFADDADFWQYYADVAFVGAIRVGDGYLGLLTFTHPKDQDAIKGVPDRFSGTTTWGPGVTSPAITPLFVGSDGRIAARNYQIRSVGPNDASGELRVWGMVEDELQTEGQTRSKAFAFTPSTGQLALLSAADFGLVPDNADQIVQLESVDYVHPALGDVLISAMIENRLTCDGPTLEDCYMLGFSGDTLPLVRFEKVTQRLYLVRPGETPSNLGESLSISAVNRFGAAWGNDSLRGGHGSSIGGRWTG